MLVAGLGLLTPAGQDDGSDDLVADVTCRSAPTPARDCSAAAPRSSSTPAPTPRSTCSTDGHRYAIANGQVTFNLDLDTPRRCGRDGVPRRRPVGPDLATPTIPDQGQAEHAWPSTARPATVGQLLHDRRPVPRSCSPTASPSVNGVEAALLKTMPIGPGGHRWPPVTTSADSGDRAHPVPLVERARAASMFGQLPDTAPHADDTANTAGGICLIYRSPRAARRSGSRQPHPAVPQQRRRRVRGLHGRSRRPDRDHLRQGRPGAGRGRRRTVFLVDDTQQRYAAATAAVLGALGYGGVKPDPAQRGDAEPDPAGPGHGPRRSIREPLIRGPGQRFPMRCGPNRG